MRLTNRSVTFTDVNDTLNIVVVLHGHLLGTLDVDTGLGLLDGQWWATLACRHEQVLDLLHIDLDHLDSNLISNVRVCFGTDLGEHFSCSERDDALVTWVPENRVRFSGTSLTVSENRIIQTFPSLLKH